MHVTSSINSDRASLHISVSFSWNVSRYGAHVIVVSSPSPSSSNLMPPGAARIWIVPENSLQTPSVPAYLYAPSIIHDGEHATIIAEYAFDAEECALLLGLFVDGQLIASGARPQLSAQFTAGGSGTLHHDVMLLVILNGPDGPFAFPPLIQTIGIKPRLQAEGGLGGGGGVKFVAFQSTFGQFNNKRVSLMNASSLPSSGSVFIMSLFVTVAFAHLLNRTLVIPDDVAYRFCRCCRC